MQLAKDNAHLSVELAKKCNISKAKKAEQELKCQQVRASAAIGSMRGQMASLESRQTSHQENQKALEGGQQTLLVKMAQVAEANQHFNQWLQEVKYQQAETKQVLLKEGELVQQLEAKV